MMVRTQCALSPDPDCRNCRLAQPAGLIQDLTHRSQVMAGARAYRVYLPGAYATSRTTRYPVILLVPRLRTGERSPRCLARRLCRRPPRHRCRFRPRRNYRPVPLYFPELIEHIDKTLRTIPDRDHRAVTGSGAGGFLAIWQAAKCLRPHRQRSSFGATAEAPVGPQGFDVDSSLTDLYPTLDAVRIRQVSADSPLAETLDFHLDAFAHPIPKPPLSPTPTSYPNFGVWDWEVVSDRRRPAFTVLGKRLPRWLAAPPSANGFPPAPPFPR